VELARGERIPDDVWKCAGYTRGLPRLGVPTLLMSDASLGVTNPGYRPGDTAPALPAELALGAMFNPMVARRSGSGLQRTTRGRGEPHARSPQRAHSRSVLRCEGDTPGGD
jgi:beta-glucosidase